MRRLAGGIKLILQLIVRQDMKQIFEEEELGAYMQQ